MTKEAQSAVLAALRFDAGRASAPAQRADWEAILAYCDRYQLTLAFARRVGECPPFVRERLDRSIAANRIRHANALTAYEAFRNSGIDHLVLKGFSLAPDFCPDAAARVQYDLDLYVPHTSLHGARDALSALGYEPVTRAERFPTDHLPPMIRKTGWEWRGDYFDTEMPLAVELHFRFWDRETERFGPASGLDELFWSRRQSHALCQADALAYASLHALRHLLRGDARPAHFYEIGYFLERHGLNVDLWKDWQNTHDPALRRLQAICFRFAQEWFGCPLPDAPRQEIEQLPQAVQEWFAQCVRSPLENPYRPNKDELWLHLSLLDTWGDTARVLRRRLLPLKPPGPVDAIHLKDHQLTVGRRLRTHWRWARFTSQRAMHHARVMVPAVLTGVRWFFAQHGLSAEFWRFFRGFVIFNTGLLVFHLLYNLHLASQGYKEDFIGSVTSAMTAGSLLGSLGAGLFAAWFGLRPSLIACFISQGALSALRVASTVPLPLLGFAFLAGISHSLYAVCLAPAIAALTGERNHPFAFSLTMASGISLGMLAGLVVGRLPAQMQSTQNTLWLACALLALGAIPIARLRLGGTVARPGLRAFLPGKPLAQFLGALAIWGFATGAFNPFFNVFFSRALHYPVETIGLIFTASQAAQVVAMLLSPILLRRLGLVRGIAVTQAAAGFSLVGLAFAPPVAAVILYPLYMAFQYMTEPGIFSRLMSGVPEEKRTGTAALNFIVVFATHAIAAWAAGLAIAEFGYTPVLASAGLLALVAARAMASVTSAR